MRTNTPHPKELMKKKELLKQKNASFDSYCQKTAVTEPQNLPIINSSELKEPVEEIKNEEEAPMVAKHVDFKLNSNSESIEHEVIDEEEDESGSMNSSGHCRLRRRDTPHHLKGARVNSPTNKANQLDANEMREILERYTNSSSPPAPLPRSQKPATQYVPNELKYEELKKHVHLVMHVNRSENSGLGIRIAGGKGSTPFREDDDGIFITKILPNSPARNTGLKIGDKLIKVNQTNLSDLSHSQAVEALKEAVNLGQQIQLQVLQELDANKVFFIKINHDDVEDQTVGFRINHNFSTYEQREVEVIHVTDQKRYAQLANGDIILQINGLNVDSMLEKDLQKYVLNSGKKDCEYEIKYLTVYRPYVERAAEGNLVAEESHVESYSEYEVEEIKIMKQNGAMGLSIVGGGNVACHPFGIEKPGIFISKIVADGAASKTNLRVGDRLIKVNGIDVTNMSHDECVDELKRNAHQVVLLISHDPQPSGMQEVILSRSHPDETIGIRINGGIENKSANPYDTNDEGIFIVNIIPNTLAHNDGRLQVGTRIMEVSV